jgi:hypothetical protein
MATLTNLESKLAEVLRLATSAQDAAKQVHGMLPHGVQLASSADEQRS